MRIGEGYLHSTPLESSQAIIAIQENAAGTGMIQDFEYGTVAARCAFSYWALAAQALC